MRIALFDYKVVPNNPIGGLHLRMLRALCQEHHFTVFAVEFENPCPERIAWVRVRVAKRPQALLFVMYHLAAPVYYVIYCLRHKLRFDLIQIVESNLTFGDIAYSHFCHQAYLKRHWKRSGEQGLRRAARWLDHRLRAFMEPRVLGRIAHIVVPSVGVANEYRTEYPNTSGKIHLLINPVDADRMRLPSGFDRAAFRRDLGFGPQHLVLVFVALGQFERKGLPLIQDALARLNHPDLRLLVVGGEQDLVAAYRVRMKRAGLGEQVVFAGMQRDVRPFLWAADGFVLPSYYESFSLVAYEAAAAGLPLITSLVSGIEDLVRDGYNGFVVQHSPEDIGKGILRFMALSAEERVRMGQRAQADVGGYTPENFVQGWRCFYASVNTSMPASVTR